MTDRNYVVVFDPLDAGADPMGVRQTIRAAIREDQRVKHWWNHVRSSFLVTFEGSAAQLGRLIRRRTEGVSFYVMEVDPRNSDGFLPERSWDWIREREQEVQDRHPAS